jgi:hypothetical protein
LTLFLLSPGFLVYWSILSSPSSFQLPGSRFPPTSYIIIHSKLHTLRFIHINFGSTPALHQAVFGWPSDL